MKNILKRVIGIASFSHKEWEIIKSENDKQRLLFFFSYIATFEIVWQLVCSQLNLLSYSFEKEIVIKYLTKNLINIAFILASSVFIFLIFLLFSERIKFQDSIKLVLYPLGLRPIMLLFGFVPILNKYLMIFSIYQLIVLGFGIYAYIQKMRKSIIMFLVIVLFFPMIILLPALLDYLLLAALQLFFS